MSEDIRTLVWAAWNALQVAPGNPNVQRASEFLYEAMGALDKPKNNPLTLDELREMDGESVWVSIIDENTCIENGYGLAFGRKGIVAIVDVDNWDIYSVWLNDYGKTWLAYRTKPEA